MILEYALTRPNANEPQRANPSDAGLDVFYSPESEQQAIAIEPGAKQGHPTGLRFGVPHGYMLEVKNRSSVAAKRSLIVGACVVDSGYDGEVFVNLHNIGKETQYVRAADKIAQLVLIPVVHFRAFRSGRVTFTDNQSQLVTGATEPWGVQVNRTRQDDKVENRQLKLLEMTPGPGRSNKYVHDGTLILDGAELRGELKSTSEDRGHFSTSSRMGVMKVEAWKEGFEFSVFSIFDSNENFLEHYVLFQKDLEPFYAKVIKKQNEGHAGRADELLEPCLPSASRIGMGQQETSKLTKQNLFGSRINDPGISVADVKQWGIRLDNQRPAEHLRELIRKEYK